MKKLLLFILFVMLTGLSLNAQHLFTNPMKMSGVMSSENYTIAYGEQAVGGVISSENYTIIIGFLGASLRDIETTTKYISDKITSIQVFPNPLQSELNLYLKSPENLLLHAELLSIQGKTIQKWAINKDIENFETRLQLKQIQAGSYLLVLKEGNKILSIIKLIKS